MNQTLKMSIDFVFHTIGLPYYFSGMLSPTCLVGAAIQLTRSYCEQRKKKKDSMNIGKVIHGTLAHAILRSWEIKK